MWPTRGRFLSIQNGGCRVSTLYWCSWQHFPVALDVIKLTAQAAASERSANDGYDDNAS